MIQRERRGDYLGKTVQMVPHATSLVQVNNNNNNNSDNNYNNSNYNNNNSLGLKKLVKYQWMDQDSDLKYV